MKKHKRLGSAHDGTEERREHHLPHDVSGESIHWRSGNGFVVISVVKENSTKVSNDVNDKELNC